MNYIITSPINLTINATIHATAHCQNTTPTAHFRPNSRRIDAIAATQGVYNKLNTKSDAAATGAITLPIAPSYRISNVDTTLSLAIKRLIREVHILQSPRPRGSNTGTIIPAIIARILFEESLTRLK